MCEDNLRPISEELPAAEEDTLFISSFDGPVTVNLADLLVGSVMTLDQLEDVESQTLIVTDPNPIMWADNSYSSSADPSLESIQADINNLTSDEKENISDGYHSFKELYSQRITIWKAFITSLTLIPNCPYNVYKCKKHHDGTGYDGWFMSLVIGANNEQISYHLPDSEWDTCSGIIYEQAPVPWDGHGCDEVLERIEDINLEMVETNLWTESKWDV